MQKYFEEFGHRHLLMENLVTKVGFFKTTINFIFVTAGFPLNALITGMFNEAKKKNPLCIEHCEKQGIQQSVLLYTLNKRPYLKVKTQ